MTDRLEKLKELAAALPTPYQDNATSLLARMEEVVEGIGDEPITWKPSLLKMVQGSTDRSSLPKGVGIGEFVLGDEKADQPLKFFPLRLWSNRQYWDPNPDNNKMLCSSPDAKVGRIGKECRTCEFGKWDEEASKSACSKVKSIIAIKSDLSDIFTVNFQKTSYSAGTDLESMLRKVGSLPYKRGYALSSKTHPKAKNVEMYTVEGLAGDERSAPDATLPFLAELFKVITADRQESVVKFYQLAQERAAQAALTNDSSTVDLSTEGGDGVTDVTSVEVEAKVSPLSKNYSV
jgi:hypothetical protein